MLKGILCLETHIDHKVSKLKELSFPTMVLSKKKKEGKKQTEKKRNILLSFKNFFAAASWKCLFLLDRSSWDFIPSL